jgi:hypothetical protein
MNVVVVLVFANIKPGGVLIYRLVWKGEVQDGTGSML